MGAVAIGFAAPASAATLAACTTMTAFERSGQNIMVPTTKGSPSCQIGRDYAANTTIVSRFQATMRQCYGGLNLASPYSDEKVGQLATDGSFGPRTEAALKAVQSAIGTAADGIYGPNTRDRMRFATSSRYVCVRY
ncbi:peptidoglycan-binding domain-containing protein [Saccharothrix deserti]|uniref:peptidoglycan-binding domain-containing protein n=1 Tax=Saccharothrix deserti TaxID=2593674 RepID=UPI00192E3CF3|nr:peptidoglycan-binding domain-containing protein [Saccharothrix deserti]